MLGRKTPGTRLGQMICVPRRSTGSVSKKGEMMEEFITGR